MLKVTTSWDDGDILDKRLADLLSRYGIKGTFYITKNYRRERLSDEDIKEISKIHEVGAHTLTHPDLRTNSVEEIALSKKWLEGVLGSKVKMFCYPKGLYNDSVIQAVKEARFSGAGTTELGKITAALPYKMPTTIQVYPFPFHRRLQSFKQRAPALLKLGVPIYKMHSWLSMSKATFDIAIKNGGVFHLWGHSWEIEKYNMWEKLEKLLQYIGNRKDCAYLPNSELIT